MLGVSFNRTAFTKSAVLLTFRIRAGGWRASLENGRPHSWNLVAAPQCPAAVASRDPHRAATPPSATREQYHSHNTHRYIGENVTFMHVMNWIHGIICARHEMKGYAFLDFSAPSACVMKRSYLFASKSVGPSGLVFYLVNPFNDSYYNRLGYLIGVQTFSKTPRSKIKILHAGRSDMKKVQYWGSTNIY